MQFPLVIPEDRRPVDQYVQDIDSSHASAVSRLADCNLAFCTCAVRWSAGRNVFQEETKRISNLRGQPDPCVAQYGQRTRSAIRLPAQGAYISQFDDTERGYKLSNQFDAKVDQMPGVKGGDWGFYAQSRARGGRNPIFAIGFPGISNFRTTLFVANWVDTFPSAIVNQFNAGFTRVSWDQGVPIDRLERPCRT